MRKHSIEVDDEIFRRLQSHARPLLDTPNDVLRRLLLNGREKPISPTFQVVQADVYSASRSTEPALSRETFVRDVVLKEFGTGFRRVAGYRMMFQNGDRLIYFQNYNKETSHLWFRVTANPWKLLKEKGQNAWICLTNPAECYAYLLPVPDIIERVHRSGWPRNYLEVNIDPCNSRWTELAWDLTEYRKAYRAGS